jgi:RNA recognition motif-containing protein
VFGEVESVILPKPKATDTKPRNFAFVHFKVREAAVSAVKVGRCRLTLSNSS